MVLGFGRYAMRNLDDYIGAVFRAPHVRIETILKRDDRFSRHEYQMWCNGTYYCHVPDGGLWDFRREDVWVLVKDVEGRFSWDVK